MAASRAARYMLAHVRTLNIYGVYEVVFQIRFDETNAENDYHVLRKLQSHQTTITIPTNQRIPNR